MPKYRDQPKPQQLVKIPQFPNTMKNTPVQSQIILIPNPLPLKKVNLKTDRGKYSAPQTP